MSIHFPGVIELDDGKIYRKALYLMVKTMVSCRFSLKPIHFPGENPIVSRSTSQPWILKTGREAETGASPRGGGCMRGHLADA